MKPLSIIWAMILLPILGCKKEEKEPPPLTAASLSPGRAAIRFHTDRNFNGHKYFEINNTADTETTFGAIGTGTRTIKLEATEVVNSSPTRKVIINILVPTASAVGSGINMTARSGIPMALINLESYSIFGVFRESKSGTLTLTRLSATEVEGNFTATTNDGVHISKGSFAGKIR